MDIKLSAGSQSPGCSERCAVEFHEKSYLYASYCVKFYRIHFSESFKIHAKGQHEISPVFLSQENNDTKYENSSSGYSAKDNMTRQLNYSSVQRNRTNKFCFGKTQTL